MSRKYIYEIIAPNGKSTLWSDRRRAIESIPERFREKVIEGPPGIFSYSTRNGTKKYTLRNRPIEDSRL